jgi:hypothetical protein
MGVVYVHVYMLTKMVEDNSSFLITKINFEFFVQCEFIDFSWLFVARVGNNPCINQVCTKMKFICLWLHFKHQDLLKTTLFSLLKSYPKVCVWYVEIIPRSSYLYSYQNAFEMEGMFVGLEYTQCWLFLFWFLGFHYFLGYIYTIHWWEDPNDSRDFHYYCEWCKSILFNYLNFWINVLINFEHYPFVVCFLFALI